MTVIEEQVLLTWQIHNRSMLLTIDHIPDDAWNASFSGRGRGVAGQLTHIHNIRHWTLESYCKKTAQSIPKIMAADPCDRDTLKEAFMHSGTVMENRITSALADGGAVQGNPRGIVPMVGSFISHECHHRGNMFITIKQAGHKLPKELQYDIWYWNKL